MSTDTAVPSASSEPAASHSSSAPAPISATTPLDAAPPEVPTEAPPEVDRPRTGVIGATVVGTLALLVCVLVGVNELFRAVMTHEVSSKIRTSADLKELRAQEEQKLTHYQWVSQKDGVVRIPLSRAQQLTLTDYGPRPVNAKLAPPR